MLRWMLRRWWAWAIRGRCGVRGSGVQPTAAELAVLYGLTKPGSTIGSVARDLRISQSAAKQRLHSLYRRLGVTSAVQALAVVNQR